MSSTWRAAAWVVAVAASVCVVSAAGSPETTGRVVFIDLQATDTRGRAVADLKPGDFELVEEGVSKPIESVRFLAATATADSAGETAIGSLADEQSAVAGGARTFAIFLDEYHVASGEPSARIRDAVLQFVDREIGPRDLVCVMKPLDSLFAIRLTRDRDAAREAIRTFEGRKGDYAPRNSYERNFMAATPPRIDAARNQVVWSAMNALAAHLGSLGDARKTLIVASEGVAAIERRRGQEYQGTRDMVLRSANRGNVAIYPIDPRVPGDSSGDAATLYSLAAETDGAVIEGDLHAALRRAAVDSASYYLLAFRTARPDDGQFYRVQVSVKRAGVGVRARKGFMAPSPDEAFRTALLARMNEPKVPVPLEPALRVSPLIRPWFGLARGADGRTRVTFVWEAASRVPGDRTRLQQPARLVLTALGPAGEVLFEGVVKPTGPAAVDEPGVTPARAVFDVKPGRLRLRMSIQDAMSKVLDHDVRDLAIRDLAGAVAIATPEVLRARNAREFRTLDAAAVPVASRVFSRTERLLIRFQAYGPAGTAVSAKLLGRLGQPMRDLAVAPSTAPHEGGNAIDLPLAGLAAGEYVVEVTATTPAGHVKDRIGFRVTS